MDRRGARQSVARYAHTFNDIRPGDARVDAEAWGDVVRRQNARSARREADAPRDLGVVHTPGDVAALMAQRLLHGVARGARLRVHDPGCGAAHLLAHVAREAARRGLRVDCEGAEVDGASARWAHALGPRVARACGPALGTWRVRRRDYLTAPARRGAFDAIVANPPWVALRDLDPDYRATLRASGDVPGRGDLAGLFVERVLEELRPGGRLCVIVPNKLLAAEYARSLRERLLRELALEEIWDLSAAAPFRGHATYPVILVGTRDRGVSRLRVHEPDGRVRASWSSDALAHLPGAIVPLDLPAASAGLLQRLFDGPRLGTHVRIACGIATSGFARGIGSGRDRIVCSGDIRAFQPPRSQPFDAAAAGLDAARLRRMRVPKVVVPGMFRRLHATFDARGRLLGRVYFIALPNVDAADERRALLLALLNSRLYAVLYRGLFAAVAQSGGWLRLNAPYLACLPWPHERAPRDLVALVRRQERSPSESVGARLDARVEALFGLSGADRRLLEQLDRRLAPATLQARPRPTRPASRIRAGTTASTRLRNSN